MLLILVFGVLLILVEVVVPRAAVTFERSVGQLPLTRPRFFRRLVYTPLLDLPGETAGRTDPRVLERRAVQSAQNTFSLMGRALWIRLARLAARVLMMAGVIALAYVIELAMRSGGVDAPIVAGAAILVGVALLWEFLGALTLGVLLLAGTGAQALNTMSRGHGIAAAGVALCAVGLVAQFS